MVTQHDHPEDRRCTQCGRLVKRRYGERLDRYGRREVCSTKCALTRYERTRLKTLIAVGAAR